MSRIYNPREAAAKVTRNPGKRFAIFRSNTGLIVTGANTEIAENLEHRGTPMLGVYCVEPGQVIDSGRIRSDMRAVDAEVAA